MQDVKIEVLESGLWLCHSKTCRFKFECANHTTAGDFRTEGGFTPELFERTPEVWACHTIDAEADYNEPAWCRNETPKGDLRSGALLPDGSTCNPHESAPRTFEEAIHDARVALEEAWRIMPHSWPIQMELATCTEALTNILNHVEKP